jgi:hypothetical protein
MIVVVIQMEPIKHLSEPFCAQMDDLSGIIQTKEKTKKTGGGMEAIREIRVLKGNTLTMVLPESFSRAQVDVVA